MFFWSSTVLNFTSTVQRTSPHEKNHELLCCRHWCSENPEVRQVTGGSLLQCNNEIVTGFHSLFSLSMSVCLFPPETKAMGCASRLHRMENLPSQTTQGELEGTRYTYHKCPGRVNGVVMKEKRKSNSSLLKWKDMKVCEIPDEDRAESLQMCDNKQQKWQ